MRIELLPGMMNVVRFPVERRARPSLDLLREIAPDVREALNLAEAFGMEAPVHDLRGRADAATAEHIAKQLPAGGPERSAMLAELLDPVVAAAVDACRAAHDASLEAAAARETLRRAHAAGRGWIEPLRGRAEALTERATCLLLAAHGAAEQAEGVARAVGLARRDEVWAPRDGRAEADALFGFAAAG